MFFKNWKFKYKVLLIPALASVVFLIIVIISLSYNKQNEHYLDLIGNGYVPALELNRDLEETLEDIQRSLQAGVASQEREKLADTDTLYNRFIRLIDQGLYNPFLNSEDLNFLKRDMQDYYSLAVQTSEKMIQGEMDEEMVNSLESMTNQYNLIKNLLKENTKESRAAMNEALADSKKNNQTSRVVMILVSLIAAVLLGGLSLFLTGLIIKPVGQLNEILKDIARGDGDLTKRINIQSNDEVGEMANWFNVFVDKIHDIIAQVKANTVQVAGAANEIGSTASQMATGADEQTAQAGEVASSVEEMTSSIMHNSQSASETAKIAEDAGAKAEEGSNAMKDMRIGMEAIVKSSTNTFEIIQSFSNSVDQIGKIIEVIDQIAEQTNLLALNAAIEAARVGEQGRGFAVVADEVRKLAERTSNSTKEISESILAIQEDAKDASESVNEANKVVAKGEEATVKTGEAIDAIIKSVMETKDMIQQIAAASEEQSSGAEEISSSVESISKVTQETASGSERLAAAAEELNSQTEALREVVDQFKLKQTK